MSELLQTVETDAPTIERFPWEHIEINGENFLVKQGITVPVQLHTREGTEIHEFSYAEYHHPETNIQIGVWSLGLDRPKDLPAIVRADYGCPCMTFGSHFTLPGHDCAKQRELAFETIAQIGIGAIATVSEQTAAGNGHGSHAVMEQLDIQWEAMKSGAHVPSLQEAHSELGYFDDKRRHDIVASVLAHSLDGRPAVDATANKNKIQQHKDAGIRVLDDVRIDLITDQTQSMKDLLRRDGYHKSISATQPGAYLVSSTLPPVLLTPETYRTHLLPQPLSHQPSRRPQLVN